MRSRAQIGAGIAGSGTADFHCRRAGPRGLREAPSRSFSRRSKPLFSASREAPRKGPTRREHSRKPDEFYERVERLYSGPFLNLFARSERPGWAAWGNEVGKFGREAPVLDDGRARGVSSGPAAAASGARGRLTKEQPPCGTS